MVYQTAYQESSAATVPQKFPAKTGWPQRWWCDPGIPKWLGILRISAFVGKGDLNFNMAPDNADNDTKYGDSTVVLRELRGKSPPSANSWRQSGRFCPPRTFCHSQKQEGFIYCQTDRTADRDKNVAVWSSELGHLHIAFAIDRRHSTRKIQWTWTFETGR